MASQRNTRRLAASTLTLITSARLLSASTAGPAMRTVGLTALLVLAAVGTAVHAQGAVDQLLRIQPGQHDHDGGETLKRAVREAITESATFADMFGRLASGRDVVLYVRTALLRHDRLTGRGRFAAAGGGVLVGFIEIAEFPMEAVVDRGIAVAHELAHAYEFACLSDKATTASIRRLLSPHGDAGPSDEWRETPFALAIERAVRREWRGRRAAKSQLDALGVQFLRNRIATDGDPPAAHRTCHPSAPMPSLRSLTRGEPITLEGPDGVRR